jgi:hypothetical protein
MARHFGDVGNNTVRVALVAGILLAFLWWQVILSRRAAAAWQ